MALLHQADLTPTKLELLAAWLPTRGWYPGPTGTAVLPDSAPQASLELTRVAGYRFDDPAGEVGVETILVQAGDGPVVQVPLTYRGAPLSDAEAFLVGTTDHSVLGKRWVYDACGDPVYANVLATATSGLPSRLRSATTPPFGVESTPVASRPAMSEKVPSPWPE